MSVKIQMAGRGPLDGVSSGRSALRIRRSSQKFRAERAWRARQSNVSELGERGNQM
jgi:hypothetical protein